MLEWSVPTFVDPIFKFQVNHVFAYTKSVGICHLPVGLRTFHDSAKIDG